MLHSTGFITKLLPKDTPSGWVPEKELYAIGGAPSGDRMSWFNWTVISAGFTGLVAARSLAELNPSNGIALIDARPIGWAASGRNSEFTIDVQHKFDLESNDPEPQPSIMTLNATAVGDLKSHVNKFDSDCEWSQAGKLQGSVAKRSTEKVRAFTEAMDRIDRACTILDRDELAAVTGNSYYSGIVHTLGCMLINPVKLVHELAQNTPENVTILDSCHVARFAREGRTYGIILRSQGCLIAISKAKALLCTNSLTPEFGYLRNCIVPVMRFAWMTGPLKEDKLEAYGGQLDWGLTPTGSGGKTLPMMLDRRLLVRNQCDFPGRFGASDNNLDRVRSEHNISFNAHYPKQRMCHWLVRGVVYVACRAIMSAISVGWTKMYRTRPAIPVLKWHAVVSRGVCCRKRRLANALVDWNR
jgi:glycine/D-amino acid oxidase-like deaminating enzyme